MKENRMEDHSHKVWILLLEMSKWQGNEQMGMSLVLKETTSEMLHQILFSQCKRSAISSKPKKVYQLQIPETKGEKQFIKLLQSWQQNVYNLQFLHFFPT